MNLDDKQRWAFSFGLRTLGVVSTVSVFVLALAFKGWASSQGGEFPGQRRGAGTHLRVSLQYFGASLPDHTHH